MANDLTNQSENPSVKLPGIVGEIAREHPDIWSAYQQLGRAASGAGPLDDRTRRLVNLALAVGGDSEGAVHSHSRRGLKEGLSAEELEQVAYLAVTTLGWPQAVRALTWIRDETRPDQ